MTLLLSRLLRCAAFVLIGGLLGCDDKATQTVSEIKTEAVPVVAAVQVLPKASKEAMSPHGTWKIQKITNPITGAIAVSVEQESKKAMYNKYSSDGFEKVTLDIGCPEDEIPNLGLFTNGVLDSDADKRYFGNIKIGGQVTSVQWRVSDNGIMLTMDESIVQRMQMGKTFIMSYRNYEGGEEFPEFDLTGLRTAMTKAGCKQLTLPS